MIPLPGLLNLYGKSLYFRLSAVYASELLKQTAFAAGVRSSSHTLVPNKYMN